MHSLGVATSGFQGWQLHQYDDTDTRYESSARLPHSAVYIVRTVKIVKKRGLIVSGRKPF